MSAVLNRADPTGSPDLDPSGWLAQLSLGFESRDGGTLLTGRRHQGPLLVQRPFYPEGPVCHVYVVHPPGGVVGGDRLEIDVHCASGSEALITSPAAGKFYRSNGKLARQSTRIRIEDDACLEWLPQETILFDRAHVESRTRFDLSPRSTLIGWEIVCLGRPACGENFSQGRAMINLEISSGGEPVLLEKLALNSEILRLSCGLKDYATVATLFCYPAGKDLLQAARSVAEGTRHFGATLLDGLLVCRMLADQAEPVRNLFASIWGVLRPHLKQRTACPPRVWAT
ncbi:MAG: urease accessory protein UreD [Gammaproteobacteria bacterium]